MLQTLFVYCTLILVMMYLSYIAREKEQWRYIVLALGLYAIVFGMRYRVGVDFDMYLHNYEALVNTNGKWGGDEHFEWGFSMLTLMISSLGLHYIFFFGIIAFLQLYCTFKAFKEEYPLYPYLIFTFMIGAQWLTYSNGLRQIMSVALWIWSIKYIVEKKFWKHYLLLILAILMHTSSLILIFFYPIFRFRPYYFKHIWVQFLLLCISLVVMQINIIQSLFSSVENLITLAGYEIYSTHDDMQDLVETKVPIGLGFFVTLLLNVLLLAFSNKVKDHFKSPYYNIIHDLFVFGVFLKYIFINSNLFSRFNYFFINVTFIVAAYTLKYAHAQCKWLYWSLIGLYLLTFVAIISKAEDNTALWVFFWQDDLYYLK